MEQLGQSVPSNSNIYINFRSAQNDSNIPQMNKPRILRKSTTKNENIEHEIFSENGMPHILLRTNLCNRPIKLFIDTGAAISIISGNIIENETTTEDYITNILGINNNNKPITTKGLVHSVFSMSDALLGTSLHVVDQKYIKNGDGYLGLDFLAPYKVIIDLNKNCLIINLKEIITSELNEMKNINIKAKNGHLNEKFKEEIEENFLNVLAQYYDFEPKISMKPQKKYTINEYRKNRNNIQFKRKKPQQNTKFKLNTNPTILPSSPNKNFKINISNPRCYSDNQIKKSMNIFSAPQLNTQNFSKKYRKIPRNKILNFKEKDTTEQCNSLQSPHNNLVQKYFFETDSNDSLLSDQVTKNIVSNTSSVHYFKDYG